MWVTNDNTKWTSRFRYFEVARFVPKINKVIRESKVLERSEVLDYAQRNGWEGVYASVFAYDGKDPANAKKLGNLYFDMDSNDLEESYGDCKKLYEYLKTKIKPENILAFFSGSKGFHIEVEAMSLGLSGSENPSELMRFIANDMKKKLDLTTLDFQVYDNRRMWRLASSKHQKTGLWKNRLTEEELFSTLDNVKHACEEQRPLVIDEVKFDYEASSWVKEYSYQLEVESIPAMDKIRKFEKYGVGTYSGESDMVFNPDVFETCHAINDLWKKAERTKDLTHEERLFLCSILTYTEEAEEYLHAILQNCSDYDTMRSEFHIKDWIRRRENGTGGRPYTCRRANSSGVGCLDCELSPKHKYYQNGDMIVQTEEFVDPSPVRLAYTRKKK